MSIEISDRPTLLLLAGIPGSGKSAHAEDLQEVLRSFGKISTVVVPDLLPVSRPDDVYDECKSVFAHRLCLKLTRAKLGLKYDYVIVDSTNLTALQRSDYAELASTFGTELYCHASVPRDLADVEACAARSSKELPLGVVMYMARIFDIPRRTQTSWATANVNGMKVFYF